MRLTLKDEGYPYKKVMQGRKWIGRVYKTADELWACDIYRRRVFTGASTALQAFQEGGAKHMGLRGLLHAAGPQPDHESQEQGAEGYGSRASAGYAEHGPPDPRSRL